MWVGGSAEELEARALLWALSCMVDRGWSRIIEGDCKTIIDSLNGLGQRSFHVQSIIDNCSMFKSSFCPCACNGVAHRLAYWAAHGVSIDVWENEAPSIVNDALPSDLVKCIA